MSPDDLLSGQPDPKPQGQRTIPRPSVYAARILVILLSVAGAGLVGTGTYFGEWYAGLGFVLLIAALLLGGAYSTRTRDEERTRDRAA